MSDNQDEHGLPEYRTEKYDSHEKLERALMALAEEGWEPVHYAVTVEMSRKNWHYVILRRPGAR